MNLPGASPWYLGLMNLLRFKIQVQLSVFLLPPLILRISPYHVLARGFPHAPDEIPLAPERPSLQHTLHLWVLGKYASGRHAFHCLYDFAGTVVWCTLYEVVHMVTVSTNFKEFYPALAKLYAIAYLPQAYSHRLANRQAPVFRRGYKVIN